MKQLLTRLAQKTPAILAAAWAVLLFATSTDARPPSTTQKAQQEFIKACQESFKGSSNKTEEPISKSICQCTAKDSINEGVKPSVLRQEAAQIRKDPKYQIKSEGLMNAFRYCTIELMRKADGAE